MKPSPTKRAILEIARAYGRRWIRSMIPTTRPRRAYWRKSTANFQTQKAGPPPMKKQTTPKAPKRSRIVQVEVSALYNLGNYSNVRYSLSAEVPKGGSARQTLYDIRHILGMLKPVREPDCADTLERVLAKPEEDRSAYEKEHLQEWAETVGKFKGRQDRRERALRLLDELGGASEFRDAKETWGDPDDSPF
jgi:hypothetical protein